MRLPGFLSVLGCGSANSSRTTLQSFYRDVYRPRIALLLLVIVLLSGSHVGQGGSSSSSSSNGRGGTRVTGKSGDSGSAGGSGGHTISVQRMLGNAETMGILVALHALWILRFIAMMYEDVIVSNAIHKSALDEGERQSGLGMDLYCIATLAGTAVAVSTTSWCRQALVFLGMPMPARSMQVSLRTMHALKALELSATLAALLGPLCKIPHPALRAWVPKRIFLPSPSHAPSLVDVLPLPPGLLEILRSREPQNMSSSGLASRASVPRRSRWAAAAGSPQTATSNTPTAVSADESVGAEATGQHLLAAPGPHRHGALPGNVERAPSGPGLREPLRLGINGITPGKRAPRHKGVRVDVDTAWIMEHAITLWGHLMGALEYLIVALSMPTLSPASFPSLLSLLSLRSELGAVATTWSSARQSVECLEFVRRRWGTYPSSEGQTDPAVPRSSSSLSLPERSRSWQTARYAASDNDEEQMCAICFEPVIIAPGPRQQDGCTLDCKHQLHAICLVQWLDKQSFCPCCHAGLKATPPGMVTGSARIIVDGASPPAQTVAMTPTTPTTD